MGPKTDKAKFKCTWSGCKEYYESESAMRRHKEDKHAGKTKTCAECKKVLTTAQYREHCHLTCPICNVEIQYKPNYGKHLRGHPDQGSTTKFSLSLELMLKDDPTTVAEGEKLAKTQMRKFKQESGEKKAGVYLISIPWNKAPSSFEKYLSGQRYPGKDSDPNSIDHRTRLHGHHSNGETNDGLLLLYRKCNDEGTRPIFFVAFDGLSTNATKKMENALLVSYGHHNLYNLNDGAGNKDLDIDQVALFGAWLWREAYRKFKSFDFSNLKFRIVVNREQNERSKAIVNLRKRKSEPEMVLTKQEAMDVLTAELERIMHMDNATTFKQTGHVENLFVPVKQAGPKLKVTK